MALSQIGHNDGGMGMHICYRKTRKSRTEKFLEKNGLKKAGGHSRVRARRSLLCTKGSIECRTSTLVLLFGKR